VISWSPWISLAERSHSSFALAVFSVQVRNYLLLPVTSTRIVSGKSKPDEDINTSATIVPSVEILGPNTRSQAQQLNHQVNSFLYSSAYNIESWLLPNDLIVLRNQGEDHGGQIGHQEGAGEPRRRAREGGEPIQYGIGEFESNSESRTTSYSNLCPDCIRPPFWTFYICTES
jgi:hypothetical protein